MRLLRTLLWTLVALACAAPTCDTHRPIAESGSGAWAPIGSPTPASTGSATHQDVVHAMESVTGTKLDPKPTKPTKPTKSHDDDGNARSHTSAPPKPELPDDGRKLGQECDFDHNCASGQCTNDRCVENTHRPSGAQCDHDSQCESDLCHDDGCE